MRRFRCLVLAVALGLAVGGCSGEINFDDDFVAGNEVELRAIERHEAAEQATLRMTAVLVLVVGPLGLSTLVILVFGRDRRSA